MHRKTAILIIIFFLGGIAIGSQNERKPLLLDGFILDSVEGKILRADSNDVWLFELADDVNDNKIVLKKGTRLELLPSSGLENMLNDLQIHPPATYIIDDGKITKYKTNNYIFLNYFRPIMPQEQQSEPNEPSSPEEPTTQPIVNDSDDFIYIPPEIRQRLEASGAQQPNTITRRTESSIDSDQNRQPQDVNDYTEISDTFIVDRTAVLVEHKKGGLAFSLDALGRNMPETSLRLLPCQVLELAEQTQLSEPETMRFKISGIKTKYKNEYYFLPQKATRLYNHGNFGG